MKQKSKPQLQTSPLQSSVRTEHPSLGSKQAAQQNLLPASVSAKNLLGLRHRWPEFCSYLSTPVCGASLAIFRIAVGCIMALEALSLCRPSASTNGRIPLEVFYTGPAVKFHFAYPGFHWLPVLPPHLIQVVVAVLAISGGFLALGLFYRLAALTL